jgi:hypothetical protein
MNRKRRHATAKQNRYQKTAHEIGEAGRVSNDLCAIKAASVSAAHNAVELPMSDN